MDRKLEEVIVLIVNCKQICKLSALEVEVQDCFDNKIENLSENVEWLIQRGTIKRVTYIIDSNETIVLLPGIAEVFQ